ncbi:hypothetical protein [Mucilaginibacter sp. FT3.2]|uniref:hypothetical protein n=1 Tax=Mucilaginibacter sp. FT3.2 TaxID=2723090 RepID=UPI0016201FAC
MSKLSKLLSTCQPSRNISESSAFIYDDDRQGFGLVINSKATHFQWDNIETAFGYKID